ncbi:hypothetical protein GCM10022216_35240 [Sphingobacterium kyonggiense]|uniref:DUF4296 domain-containing protein n=2 Tax=Sphingobacterium kyonggiense TaxID=714075 RepID=A0ABP7Z6S1_9SPHI
MTEVHILDGYIGTIPIDSARKVIDPLYNQLLEKYKLDTLSFDKNVDYYMGNPNLTAETYGNIVKNLEVQEKEFYKKDSIRNAIFQDSVSRVMMMTRKMDLANQMILNAKSDSIKMTPAENTRRLYNLTGISWLWDKNMLLEPLKQETPVAQPIEPMPEVEVPPASEMPKVEEVVPRAIDTARGRLDLKPVRRKSQSIIQNSKTIKEQLIH